jgi:hypothetical protein
MTEDCKLKLPCVETVASTESGLTITQTRSGTGVYIQSSSGPALSAMSTNGEGLVGVSSTKAGVKGQSGMTGIQGSGKNGVSGRGTSIGVIGDSEKGTGVLGSSKSGTAGKFVAGMADITNPNAAIEGITLARGSAARFRIERPENDSPGIDVSTDGSGPAAKFTVTSKTNGTPRGLGFRSVLNQRISLKHPGESDYFRSFIRCRRLAAPSTMNLQRTHDDQHSYNERAS